MLCSFLAFSSINMTKVLYAISDKNQRTKEKKIHFTKYVASYVPTSKNLNKF